MYFICFLIKYLIFESNTATTTILNFLWLCLGTGSQYVVLKIGLKTTSSCLGISPILTCLCLRQEDLGFHFKTSKDHNCGDISKPHIIFTSAVSSDYFINTLFMVYIYSIHSNKIGE